MTSSPEFHQLTLIVGGLKSSVDHMSQQWHRQEESASAGRKALHEKFEHFREEVGIQISGLSLRVDRAVDTLKNLEKLEPAVKKYEAEKEREEGAKKLGAKLVTALTAVAGVIGWGLHELVGYLKH